MSFKDTYKQLVNEVAKIGSDYYSGDRYEEPNAFAYWFCKAALSIDPDDSERIKRAVTNGPDDQNFDIIFINQRNTTAFAVQTKYSKNLNSKNEGQNDINALVKNAKRILQDREATFNAFKNTCRPDMQSKVWDLFKAVREDGFKLKFIYVTTSLISEAKKKAAQDDFDQLRISKNLTEEDLELLFYEGSDVCKVYKNYAVLVPCIPSIVLEKVGDSCNPNPNSGKSTGIPDSRVFAVTAKSINQLFSEYKDQLFARNVRLCQGEDKPVNKEILKSIKSKPDHFFYKNNGITFLAKSIRESGPKTFHITEPQIINGQQTTRTLGRMHLNEIEESAHVLVKVIAPAFHTDNEYRREKEFIQDIVRSTNSQTKISWPELFSNNIEHILIEKDLYDKKWFYSRKSGDPSDQTIRSTDVIGTIKLEQLAQACMANEHDPQKAPAEGTRNIFVPTHPDHKMYYKKIFLEKGRKTDEFIINHLVTRHALTMPADRDKNIQKLYKRGRWYVSHVIFNFLKVTYFNKPNGKRVVLRMLGNPPEGGRIRRQQTPSKKLFKAIDSVYSGWFKFYKLHETRYPNDAVGFTKSNFAAKSKWLSFWKKRCRPEIRIMNSNLNDLFYEIKSQQT